MKLLCQHCPSPYEDDERGCGHMWLQMLTEFIEALTTSVGSGFPCLPVQEAVAHMWSTSVFLAPWTFSDSLFSLLGSCRLSLPLGLLRPSLLHLLSAGKQELQLLAGFVDSEVRAVGSLRHVLHKVFHLSKKNMAMHRRPSSQCMPNDFFLLANCLWYIVQEKTRGLRWSSGADPLRVRTCRVCLLDLWTDCRSVFGVMGDDRVSCFFLKKKNQNEDIF